MKSALKSVRRDVFGGESLRNATNDDANNRVRLRGLRSGGTHAKRKRPVQAGEWLHVCLKSKIARGELSMLRPKSKKRIERIISMTSRKAGVKISSWQNVGNHLHFSVKPASRQAYNRWIRSASGLIARAVLGAERGPRNNGHLKMNLSARTARKTPFWESRPFTRIVRGFEAFDRLSRYIKKNKLEALGFSKARAKEIVRMIATQEMYLDQTAAIDISRPPPE